MVTDLVDRLQAAIDAELKGTDWPHRPTCQMLKPVPPGFPFDCFSCNCDAVDTWMRIHETNRKILGGYAAYRARLDRKFEDDSDIWHFTGQGYVWYKVILALTEAYGITQ
jgi:hypothetical protein